MQIRARTVFASVFLFVVAAGHSWAGEKPASDAPSPKLTAGDDAKKDDPKKADAKKVEWHSLFDGKALGEWKPSKFATQGSVDVEDGQIVLGFGDGCSGITWKGRFPNTNYEIRLEA